MPLFCSPTNSTIVNGENAAVKVFLIYCLVLLFQNITFVRAKKDNPLLNNLNFTQANRHFGGIVSILPSALELARQGIARMVESRAYKPITSTPQG